MGIYDEQIRKRISHDDEMFASSFDDTINAVLGRSFSFGGDYPESAIGMILQYYRVPVKEVPDNIKTPEERMKFTFRAAGVMQREVDLTDKWYKNALGAMLVKRKETEEVVALIPGGAYSYRYFDEETKKFVRVTAKNAEQFESDAVCFYRPFPSKKISGKDLLKYCISTWATSDVVMLFVLLLFSTLLGLFTPKISYFFFSQVVTSESVSLLISTLVFAVCVTGASLLLRMMHRLFTQRIGIKMSVTVDSATMMRVLSLPQSFFKEYSAGDLSLRIEYLQAFCVDLIDETIMVGLTGVFSIAYFSQIIVYAPSLAVPSLLIIIASLGFSVISTLCQLKISKKRMSLNAKNNCLAFDTISGIQKIKLAGAEKRMFSRFATDFANVVRATYNPPVMIKITEGITLAITLIGDFLLYYFALKNHVGVSEYYAFDTAFGTVSAGLSLLSGVVVSIADLSSYFTMAKPILDTIPEGADRHTTAIALRGSIELNRVSFRYNEDMPDVIRDFSLKIRPGEYVAIVGKSGCGKSTLVRLLLGFEKPRKGAIYYDGKDMNSLDLVSLRRSIGTVMQDDQLFFGSIYSNITVCAPNAPLEQAWEAADLAGISDDIEELPMGMHTMVTENGGGFSGGQKQRLIIARAICPKPKVLIFDEATSALDNNTQKVVSESLDSLKCTRIVIAHRLSTVKHCDRILYMEGGRIVEEGKYDDLMARKGLFADLVARQQVKPIDEGEEE